MKKALLIIVAVLLLIVFSGCSAAQENGKTPYIKDGYWYIDGINLGVKAEGKDGAAGTDGVGIQSLEVIDGCLWVTYDNDGENRINIGKISENNDNLLELIGGVFEIESDKFVCEYETLNNPSWHYTYSTFSGWGGSIGKPQSVEAIAIKVRAREKAITQIKFHLNIDDKNGDVIAEELMSVNIPAGEEAEIVWELSQKLTDNSNYLYLSYNCNQLCDLYTDLSSKSTIPENEYQAITSYSVSGKILDSASQMTNISGEGCRYLYARIGVVKDVLTFKEQPTAEKEKINVFLPDEYDIAVNDNFQLFYRGVVQAVNPYNYDIKITCEKGKAYSRYYEWKPTVDEVGSYSLTLTVCDDNGNVLGSDKTKLIVHAPTEPSEAKNVLCIGDSLTAGGYWAREAQRRFNEEGGVPEGLEFDCLNFIGTNTKNVNGQAISTEGYGGWTWQMFCGTESPFYDESMGDISFKSYCDKNGFEGIDIVYILLTWNGQGTPHKTDYSLDGGHFIYAKKIIDTLHEEYPDAIVRCLGIQISSQNGGMGDDYGANGGYSDDYGMLVTAMNYNAALEDFCQLPQYRDFVKFVDVAGQFDTDYNMPSAEKPVNNRNEITETVGNNGVHPSVNGYYQIADAVFRSLCEIFSR